MEVLFDGRNPYIDAIRANMTHLLKILDSGDWSQLRRQPPYFLGILSTAEEMESLVNQQLKSYTGTARKLDDDLLMPI